MDRLLQRIYPEWAHRVIDIPKRSVYSILAQSASKYSGNVAIEFIGKKITYGELKETVDSISISLGEIGIKKGDRVSLMMPNIPQYPIFFFAILKIGGIIVQTNPLYTTFELEHQVEDSGSDTIVVMDDFIDKVIPLYPSRIERIIVVRAEDYLPKIVAGLYSLSKRIKKTRKRIPKSENIFVLRNSKRKQWESFEEKIDPLTQPALLQYTGGTTGIAKGAVLSHMNLVSNAYQIVEWLPPEYKGEISYLSAIPFFHVYGMMTALLTPMLQGSKIIIVPDPRDTHMLVKTMSKKKPVAFPGIPAMYHSILYFKDVKKYNIKAVKVCISGASPLPEELQNNFERETKALIVEGYGLSESSPVANVNPLDASKRKVGSIGLPLPNTYERIVDIENGQTDMKVGEVGELIIKGPQVMLGYWNNQSETQSTLRDGWLYTGDIAKMDENGFVYVVDRKKDLIIASGYNVYPREVEEVLYSYPKISEAAVVGIEDPHRGENVKAYVVLKKGENATEEEIREFCGKHLAVYKVPKIVEFRESLPMSLVGKVLKRELKNENKSVEPQ